MEKSIAGMPEDRSGREVGFRDQGYIDIMHIDKRSFFQPVRREAVGVPEQYLMQQPLCGEAR